MPAAHCRPIIAQIDAGHFKAADAAITRALAQPGTSDATRRALLFQRERMRRILLDFTLDADDVEARVRQSIPDLTEAEFSAWNAAGLFEHRTIDGRTLYFKRSPGNLFRLSAEAVARRAVQTPMSDGPMEALNDHQRAIYHAALTEHRSSVLPQRVRMTQMLTVDADAVPAGETVRAWIPYPQAIPGQQEDIRFVTSEPAQHEIAPAFGNAAHGVSGEARARGPQDHLLDHLRSRPLFAQYHPIDAAKVQPRTDHPGAGAVRGRARTAYRVHRRDARVLAQGGRRREESVPHRAETVRRRRPDSLGRRAANTRRSPTSATTRCMPATPTAASRPCC